MSVERLADLFRRARRAVVFTGAGVSTDSGIPDFRSPDGVWARHDPRRIDYASFMGGVEGRRRYWTLGRELYPVIRAARPNAAHEAIAELGRGERLACCITQNIDGLHQRAGLPSERVVELHGNATRARCLGCGAAWSRDEVHGWRDVTGAEVPECPECGGIVKPTTVLFGEPLPPGAMATARRHAEACDLFVVVGSSLAVFPAAYVPRHARRAGATLAIVNLGPTPLDGEAELVIRAGAGEVMPAVASAVREVPA